MDDTRTVVRTNWLRFSWNQISRANKVLLVITTLISLVQVIVTAVVLGIGGQQHLSCNKPLQMYLIIFVIRVGVSLPFAIYQHLTTLPRRRRRSRRRQRRTTRRSTTTTTTTTTPSSENHAATNTTATTSNNDTTVGDTNSMNETDNNNNTSDDTTAAANDQSGNTNLNEGEQQPATLITGWANRIKSLLDLFAILWFIVGNYLVYAPSDCAVNAAPYLYTILTFVIFGYLIMLIPVLICASVIFCLPCVLVAIRMFNINITNLMEGGSKEEIANIPIFRYEAHTLSDDDDDSQENSPKVIHNDHAQQQSDVRQPKRKFNFFKKKTSNNDDDNKQYDYFTIPKPEDAVCSICLCEYEDNELICKLWCDHHYHKECVHEWLGLNSTCPLCKRDFRGKDYQNSDDEGDSEEEH